jgi:MoxR-like ATPase
VLGHRILLHAEAQFDGASVEKVIDSLLADIEPPVRRGA